jgi:predicted SprT family Zn-dependent metalloprotease
MKLIKAELLCIRLMVKWGVFGDGNLKWKWGGFMNKRNTLGECYILEGEREIRLSRHYVEQNDEAMVTNTILHEIAHALDIEERGDSAHDANFRKWCRHVGCPEDTRNAKAKVKYLYNDKCCGTNFRKHRLFKENTYHCKKCDRELFVKQRAARELKLDPSNIISVR